MATRVQNWLFINVNKRFVSRLKKKFSRVSVKIAQSIIDQSMFGFFSFFFSGENLVGKVFGLNKHMTIFRSNDFLLDAESLNGRN